ncbi:MAG: ArsA family ATPase [Solirubrobacterales bacterium]|jgi:arsenite-transporting ATPase|nr:ArsA family ATPase [Solirubrobacterales bacterium]
MAPRTILYTGKGGVGKTSVAAATARRCAAAGQRTIVLSTDPAHSLADALEQEIAGTPTDVGGGLFAQQVAAQAEMERHWSAVQAWAGELLRERGADRVSAEELTVPPGMDELFSLLQIKAHHESDDWDVVIVDCAPTGETLRLLSFPDVLRWWLAKVFPQQSRLMDAARPLARMVLDLRLPDDAVIEEVNRLVGNLIAMNEILRDHERVSIRLVTTPDRMVVDEARRTFTYLNLYGFLTDAVVVNRVFPAEVGGYFGPWRERQLETLEEVRAAFAPVPVLTAPYFAAEVVGGDRLDELAAAAFDGTDPSALLLERLTQELVVGERTATLRLELPFAQKGDITLRKIGAEVIVRVDDHKRTVVLPGALAGYRATSASFEDGALELRFDEP